MNPWKRKGFFYYATGIKIFLGLQVLVTKKFDFFSYHLIKLVHGEKKLIDIAFWE